MEESLRFFKDNEVFIYLFLGIIAVWQLRKFSLAWGELRGAAFGLERESAQTRLNWVASMLVFMLVLGVAEFALVSFIVPTVPDATPLSTPTLDLLAAPTTILDTETSDAFSAANATPLPIVETENEGCIPGLVDIISPAYGDTVQGIVAIIGTADIPNFGFYKFEMAALNDASWLTIQAGDIITHEGRLGYWDTARLAPGDYTLRLVVTDNQGQPTDPCVVQVHVELPTD